MKLLWDAMGTEFGGRHELSSTPLEPVTRYRSRSLLSVRERRHGWARTSASDSRLYQSGVKLLYRAISSCPSRTAVSTPALDSNQNRRYLTS